MSRTSVRSIALACAALGLSIAGRTGEVRAAFRGDNGKVAFQHRDSAAARSDIWVVNPDGTEPTNLTNTPDTEDRYPDFAPDGRRIAFIGGADLVVMNSDGTDARVVVPGAGSNGLAFPGWSPDGTKIAVGFRTTSGASEIRIFRVSDGALLDTFAPPAGNSYSEPAWRPTAAGATDIAALRIYADGKRDIVRLTSSGEVNLTNTPGDFIEGGQLHWSPDGSMVVYRSRSADPAELNVIAANVAGGQFVLHHPSGTDGTGQDISPDGGVLVYDEASTGNHNSPIYTVTIPGGTPVLLARGTNPCWGRGPGAGFTVTLEAFEADGGRAEGRLLVEEDFVVKLTLTNGTDSTLDRFSFTGGSPLVIDRRSIGGLAITASPPIDADLSLEPGETAEFSFSVTTTREGIAAAHTKAAARAANGDDVEEFHSLVFRIENAQEVTKELGRYVLLKAMDDYLFAQFRNLQDQLRKRAGRLRAALTKRLDANERLEWFGSSAEIEVSNMDVALGFLRGLPPELIAASRPKAGFKGFTSEQLDAAYAETFKDEAGKGLAQWVEGYESLAAGAKSLAEEGWAAALMNVGWLNSTATAEERAQVESFWTAFVDGSTADARSLAFQWKNDLINWQATGTYMWQALEQTDRDYTSFKAQVTNLKKGYKFMAGIVKKETDVRASIMQLADDDPVAFQREWARQDARILNAGLPLILDTLLGAGVAKVASVGGQALKFRPKGGIALLEGAKEAGYVDDLGREIAAGSKILPSDPGAPTGLPLHTGADVTRAERFLKDTKGATLVQSSDHGNVYSLPNLGGVPEPTLDAKASILRDLEREYLAATGKEVKLVEVLKTSSPLRKPGGVAKLELTAAKTGKPSMVDAGMPADALGEAVYWTSPTSPTELPGFGKLPRARQEAAITEWENANKRYAAYSNPPPNSKEAHLRELIGKRGRVPLDDNPNAAGIQRFINGEFEEVVVTKGDATAKLIRVKHYEIEVVDTTRNNLVVNRKTVVDDLATAAPQTADADAVAVGKLVGTDPVTGAPIVEPLSRAEREFVMGRYIDKNVKARRAGVFGMGDDFAEHGVTLVMEDASAKAAGFLLPRYGAVFLPDAVGRGYLARIAPYVNHAGTGLSDFQMFEELLAAVKREGGFGQHAVVVTSDSRYLGAVPFASW